MSYLLTEKLTSTIALWMVLRRISKKWEDWDAAKLGIISPVDGKRLRRPVTAKEREGWDLLDRFCWQIKRIMTRFMGDSKFAYLFSLAYLMRESYVPIFQSNLEKYKPELENLTLQQEQLLYEIVCELDKRNILFESHLDIETNGVKVKDTVKDVLNIFLNRIQSIKDCTKVQCSDGNYNFAPYMHGMANGLILALGIMKGEPDIKFLDAPDKWIEDKTIKESKQVGILYHYTSYNRALKILETNILESIGYKKKYVSFTRNKNFHRYLRSVSLQCRFVVDGTKLSENYRVIPFSDFSHSHYPDKDEQEEKIKGSIVDFRKFILKLQLFDTNLLYKIDIDNYKQFCEVEIIDPQKIYLKEDLDCGSTSLGDMSQYAPPLSINKDKLQRRVKIRRQRNVRRKSRKNIN
jgi:hypothetical protein